MKPCAREYLLFLSCLLLLTFSSLAIPPPPPVPEMPGGDDAAAPEEPASPDNFEASDRIAEESTLEGRVGILERKVKNLEKIPSWGLFLIAANVAVLGLLLYLLLRKRSLS